MGPWGLPVSVCVCHSLISRSSVIFHSRLSCSASHTRLVSHSAHICNQDWLKVPLSSSLTARLFFVSCRTLQHSSFAWSWPCLPLTLLQPSLFLDFVCLSTVCSKPSTNAAAVSDYSVLDCPCWFFDLLPGLDYLSVCSFLVPLPCWLLTCVVTFSSCGTCLLTTPHPHHCLWRLLTDLHHLL